MVLVQSLFGTLGRAMRSSRTVGMTTVSASGAPSTEPRHSTGQVLMQRTNGWLRDGWAPVMFLGNFNVLLYIQQSRGGTASEIKYKTTVRRARGSALADFACMQFNLAVMFWSFNTIGYLERLILMF